MSDWWAAHDVADMAAGLDQIMPGNDDFLEQSTFKGLTSELSGTPLQNSNTSHMGPLAAKAKVDQMARRGGISLHAQWAAIASRSSNRSTLRQRSIEPLRATSLRLLRCC